MCVLWEKNHTSFPQVSGINSVILNFSIKDYLPQFLTMRKLSVSKIVFHVSFFEIINHKVIFQLDTVTDHHRQGFCN